MKDRRPSEHFSKSKYCTHDSCKSLNPSQEILERTNEDLCDVPLEGWERWMKANCHVKESLTHSSSNKNNSDSSNINSKPSATSELPPVLQFVTST